MLYPHIQELFQYIQLNALSQLLCQNCTLDMSKQTTLSISVYAKTSTQLSKAFLISSTIYPQVKLSQLENITSILLHPPLILVILRLFLCLVLAVDVWDRVSHSLCWPRTCFVDKAGLELPFLLSSPLTFRELKECTVTPNPLSLSVHIFQTR